MNTSSLQRGSINPLLISTILLAVLAVAFGGVMVWALSNYNDQKNNTDSKINAAVTIAKKKQTDIDQTNFFEKYKQPFNQLVGPDDFGHVTFNYPKTWSVYIAQDGSKDSYQAYLNPVSVPPVSTTTAFAARVVIDSTDYAASLNSYQSAIKKGDLKSVPIVVNGFTGIRLDGKFSSSRQGSEVIFKVRDKTLIIATDSTSFQSDFDNTIVKSLDFNP